jgi:hypothetical protein
MSTTTRSSTRSSDTYVTALPVDELFADDAYQRPLDTPRARRAATSWDPRMAGIIDVSDRGEAATPRWAIIDGQHRWAAAKLAGITALAANVHTGLSCADEAKLFDRLNRERRRITTWDHWRARSAAGDPAVAAIERTTTELGLIIDSSPRAGHVRCTSTLEKLQALGGEDLIERTLQLILNVWGRDVAGFDAPIVHGIGLALHYLGDLDVRRLAEALIDVQPRQLKARAIALRDITTGTTPKLVAIATVTIYNARPGRKILVSTRTFGGTARNAHSSVAAVAS